MPKASNVHIDGSLLHVDMIAPDLVEQLASTVDALGMGHEKVKKSKLCWAKVKALLATRDAMC